MTSVGAEPIRRVGGAAPLRPRPGAAARGIADEWQKGRPPA